MRDFLYPLRVLHGKMHEHSRERNIVSDIKKRIRQASRDTVMFVMTPEHGNLGDHALAYSESRMLNAMGISYLEITSKEIARLSRFKQLRVLNRYPILFNGGGYLGTFWPKAEQHTREIIRSAPDSTILMLPNTIFYPDTQEGQRGASESAAIFNAHPHLHVYAREKCSYEKMCSLYRNVKLVPDMVLSLKGVDMKLPRNGCILSLRRDHEKSRTDDMDERLHDVITSLFGSTVTELDMVVDYPVLPKEREAALEKRFRSFGAAELVVTDRLHGMIFSALTETPCIVIDSKSPKVRGCYEWIRELGYIRFADSPEQIPDLYRAMPANCRYTNDHLQLYYDELKKDIAEELMGSEVQR